MMAKKSKLLVAFILVLSLIVTYSAPISVYAVADPEPTTKNFKVNLFNYDQNTVNQASKNTFYGSDKNKKILAFFGTGSDSINDENNRGGHSICHDAVYTGIVKNNLNSGRPELVSSIHGIDFFRTSGQTPYNYYSNVNFPFTYSNGYYEYDSAKNSATYQNGKITLGSANGGFWPFMNDGQNDYHFGLSMEVEFFIPENRKVDGKDMIFSFSGDDDVWVFVDGKLVLDLGGIHGTKSGSINFTTGNITNANKYQGCPTPDDSLDDDFNWKSDVTKGDFKEFSKHTLKVFYLERGAGLSNLSMKFNIPQFEPLTVEKEISELNPGFTVGDSFDFAIKTSDRENGYYSDYSNKPFDVYTKNGAFVKAASTDSEGEFSLKTGQRAEFSGLDHGKWFAVYEVDSDEIYGDETWVLPDPNNQGIDYYTSYGWNLVKGKFSYDAEEGDFAVICQNPMKTTDVFFDKYDSMFPETPVSGAAFELTATSDVTGSAIAHSDENGEVVFEDIPKGTYTLREISAPKGYVGSDEVYTVIVGYSEDNDVPRTYSKPKPKPELGFKIYDADEELISMIFNDPKMIDLTITKKVQGSYAPENASPAGIELYPFIISFGDGFELTSLGAITSEGAFDLSPINQTTYRVASSDEGLGGSAYSFYLTDKGFITFPIKEGVRYSVYEDDGEGEYQAYFMMSGDAAEAEGSNGITAEMTTTSALTVLNQYKNDGLTVLKLVSGNQAPEEDTFDFTAKFWAPESQETMETALFSEVEKKVSDASAAVTSAEALMTDDDWNALSAAEQAVTDAAVSLAALTADLETAQDEYDLADDALEVANASAAAIQEQIDALDGTTDPAIIAEIEALELEIDALNIADLETALEEAEDALDDAKAAYDDAVQVKEDADTALSELKTTPGVIKDYLDAQEALETAQAEYEDAQTNPEENIFVRIWNRAVEFFISLVVGETYGEGVDIVYSGTPSDFAYDSVTSECAFSLGITDSITFNFDQYFEDNPDVDKVFFEITETDKGSAKGVDVETTGDPFPEAPEIAESGKMIKGYVERQTMDPTIVYTNEYANIIEREYIVYHKTEGGTVLSSYSAIGIVGDSLNIGPRSFEDYSYKSVSAVGMTVNPDEDGDIDDIFPDTDDAIVITYIYAEDEDDPDPSPGKRRSGGGTTATTEIVEEPVPETPVTPEAIDNGEQVILSEDVPAAPLPKTGGVPSLLLYGLGALLAGGGAALKLRNKKKQEEN
jgi:fibro-slime domain-containing protein/LPXTG-motif cell wall-anchored protein